jgi:hypothetical protein
MAGLCASLLLVACSASRQSAPRQYAQSVDSATNAGMRNPELITPQVGERIPVIPPLRPPPPVAGALTATAVAGGQAVIDDSESLDAGVLKRIDKALAECANTARSQMVLKHFNGRSPTREECNEEVGSDSQGKPITRAMRLGVEQHEVALKCAKERLNELKPGGFSISPRYRYDPKTGKATHIPREAVEELLNQGRGAELRGTLEPDIVIHAGKPHQVQAVRDYKFPCVNTDKWSSWRQYPEGQVHSESNQYDLYWKVLKVEPAMVQPHLGVRR